MRRTVSASIADWSGKEDSGSAAPAAGRWRRCCCGSDKNLPRQLGLQRPPRFFFLRPARRAARIASRSAASLLACSAKHLAWASSLALRSASRATASAACSAANSAASCSRAARRAAYRAHERAKLAAMKEALEKASPTITPADFICPADAVTGLTNIRVRHGSELGRCQGISWRG